MYHRHTTPDELTAQDYESYETLAKYLIAALGGYRHGIKPSTFEKNYLKNLKAKDIHRSWFLLAKDLNKGITTDVLAYIRSEMTQ